MKKIFSSLVFIFLLSFLAYSSDARADASIKVFIDDNQMPFDEQPLVEDGTTLVQFRPIFERLGMLVQWDSSSRSVSGSRNGLGIKLYIDNNTASVNGQQKHLDKAARIINGSTFVPLRFVAETTGFEVKWDEVNNEVHIVNKKIFFPDPKLDQIIRRYVNKPSGDLTLLDVNNITGIYDIADGLKSLAGLENLKNLQQFQIQKADLSAKDSLLPFVNLKKITFLDLYNNNITNIEPLTNLTNLQNLSLMKNPITDLSPLKNLTNLESLLLSENPIDDISVLQNIKLKPSVDNAYNGFFVTENNKYYKMNNLSTALNIDGKIYLMNYPASPSIYLDQKGNYYLGQMDMSFMNFILSIAYKHYKIGPSSNPFVNGTISATEQSKSYFSYENKYASITETYQEGKIINENNTSTYSYRIKKNDNVGFEVIPMRDQELLLLPLSKIMKQFDLIFNINYDAKNKIVSFAFK